MMTFLKNINIETLIILIIGIVLYIIIQKIISIIKNNKMKITKINTPIGSAEFNTTNQNNELIPPCKECIYLKNVHKTIIKTKDIIKKITLIPSEIIEEQMLYMEEQITFLKNKALSLYREKLEEKEVENIQLIKGYKNYALFVKFFFKRTKRIIQNWY